MIVPAGPFSVGSNGVEDAPVGPPLTATGTGPLVWSIQSGNTNNIFRIGAADGQIRVNLPDISAYENQHRNLVIRATGPSGLFDEETVRVDITETVYPPVFDPATLNAEFAEGSAIGTEIVLTNLGGSPAATLTITSGNSADRWEAVAPNIVRNKTAILRSDSDARRDPDRRRSWRQRGGRRPDARQRGGGGLHLMTGSITAGRKAGARSDRRSATPQPLYLIHDHDIPCSLTPSACEGYVSQPGNEERQE